MYYYSIIICSPQDLWNLFKSIYSLDQPMSTCGVFCIGVNWKLTSYLFFAFLWDLSWLFFLWRLLSSSEPE